MRLIQGSVARDKLIYRMMLCCVSIACEWAISTVVDLLATVHWIVPRTLPASQVSASPVDGELVSKVREFSRCWFSR